MSDTLPAEFSKIRGFTLSQLSRFLSVVALELTISGKETYVPASMDVEDPVRLRALNECIHFIVGILRRALFAEEVDLASLVETLSSVCSDKYAGAALQSALRRAMRQVQATQML